jgi:enamine deaminase RidA (YjgF/YER057c/UK114 family)
MLTLRFSSISSYFTLSAATVAGLNYQHSRETSKLLFAMTDRTNIGSGAPWEDIVGYSRAVKIGPLIEVSGTTAIDAQGNVVGEGDAYAQTRFIIQKAADALAQLGTGLHSVVRTRMFVTDITQWEQIGKAHGEFFKEIKPAATMVEVKALIDPKLLIEIEFTAWMG